MCTLGMQLTLLSCPTCCILCGMLVSKVSIIFYSKALCMLYIIAT
jgi:hypothetical protein